MVGYFACQNESQNLSAQVNRNYLAWANIKGVDSDECKRLGMLFSRVIDSTKTGETFNSRDLMSPDEGNCSSKEPKYIWQKLGDNADRFNTRMKECVFRKAAGFPTSSEVAEEFVLSIVTQELSNISEFEKFQFVWNYISNVATEKEEKVEVFLDKYSDHLNYALFSNEEKREAIALGIPADVVINALRKSKLLSRDDLDVFAMNTNPNRWKFYFREDHENFNWMYMLKALTHHDKCFLVVSLPDEVIIVLQFLTKQKQGEQQELIPGTVSGYLYSKRFQYRLKYVLGPEYTMDLTENRLQLYRHQDLRQTFVWLRSNDQRKGTKTKDQRKLQQGDEVLNSISVDLTRFKSQIFNEPRRHPLVNKIPLVTIEVFVENNSLTVPYFDTFEANDLEPVAETEDLDYEEDYDTERDLSFMLSEDDLDLCESCKTEENLVLSLKRTITEGKPLLFQRFVDDWHKRTAEVPSCVSELSVSLLESIVVCSTPQHLPEQVSEAIRKILLTCKFNQPLQLFKVTGYLSRIHLEDLAAELISSNIEKCKIDLPCFINIYSQWRLWWYVNRDIAKQTISHVAETVSLCHLSQEGNSEAENQIKYLLHISHLHFLDFLQEIETVRERMKSEKADFSICNLKLQSTLKREDDFDFVSFYRVGALDHRPRITQGQFVAVTRQADFKKIKSHESCCCLAQVQTIRPAPLTVTVKLFGQVPAIIANDLRSRDSRLWKIDLIPNITTFTRVMNAIKSLTKVENPWLLNLLANPAGHPKDCLLFRENVHLEIPEREGTLSVLEIPSNINEKQREAVHAALKQKLTLIQGPPGAGKTTLACEIVKQAEKLGKDKKILVVAETNVAVDIIAKELRKDLPLDILRLGTEEGVDRDVFDVTLDGQLKQIEEKEAKKASYQDEKGIVHRIPKLVEQILDKARIFLTTCAGAGDPLLDSQTFEFVLVDEATQTKETTLLCSLAHGVNQLVMIGDPKQLVPVTVRRRDQQAFAIRDSLDVSALSLTLFHRLYEVMPCKLLDTQNRMHPELMKFPSEIFYDGKLKCGPVSFLPAVFKWPDSTKPLCFINVDSKEERTGTSFCNREEMRIVQRVLDVLMNVPDDKKDSRLDITEIGILTPYQGQAKLLSTEVKPNVEVRTVDGFQGREKEVIIVSTVRANDRGTLGFLESAQRLNVLLTRAKRGLIVVGNEGTLKNSPLWNKWIELAPQLSYDSLVKPESSEKQATRPRSNKRPQKKASQFVENDREIQDGCSNFRGRTSAEGRQGGQSIPRGRGDRHTSTRGRTRHGRSWQGASTTPRERGGLGASPAPRERGGQGASPTPRERGGQGASHTSRERGGQGASPTPRERGGQGASPTPRERGGQGASPTPRERGGQDSSHTPRGRGGPPYVKR